MTKAVPSWKVRTVMSMPIRPLLWRWSWESGRRGSRKPLIYWVEDLSAEGSWCGTNLEDLNRSLRFWAGLGQEGMVHLDFFPNIQPMKCEQVTTKLQCRLQKDRSRRNSIAHPKLCLFFVSLDKTLPCERWAYVRAIYLIEVLCAIYRSKCKNTTLSKLYSNIRHPNLCR